MGEHIKNLTLIKNHLNALRPAGESGFEGLLRDAVSKVIQKRLILSKGGGAQGGSDMGTSSATQGPAIAVEAKRYGTAPLKLDDLKAKLIDAVRSKSDLDVMVYGATCEINQNDRMALDACGDDFGVGVAFIDWSESSTMLPRLAVLCALLPETLIDRAKSGGRENIANQLAEIAAHPNFKAESENLIEELTQPDMGWESARASIENWHLEAMAERDRGFSRLHSVVNLLDEQTKVASRPKLSLLVSEWFSSPNPLLALLGREGVGKSWSFLAWWIKQSQSTESTLPVTLVIPAVQFGGGDINGLIAQTLHERTRKRNVEFWRRRLDLWLSATKQHPRFLLFFDGLNENWEFSQWREVIAKLNDGDWKHNAKIAMSCRPDHWRRVRQDIEPIGLIPTEVTVPPFSDEELDNLLELHGLDRAEFVPALISLLKIPRLSVLAIRHRATMAESGDITPERLVFEDWKDRVSRYKGAHLISSEEFHEYVRILGTRLYEQIESANHSDLTLNRKEIAEFLSTESTPSEDVIRYSISEIVDGNWMEGIVGKPNRFRLQKDKLPFVLSMLLVDRLSEVDDKALDGAIAEFADPLNEQDYATQIFRHAAVICHLDERCSTVVRQSILKHWLRRQNLSANDFHVFWRIIPEDINTFLAFYEEMWLRRAGDPVRDEFMIKAFANAAENWDKLGIVEWSTEWLATHWDHPEDEDAEQSPQSTERNRKSWEKLSSDEEFLTSIPIRDKITGDVPWLAYRVIGILSYLPVERVLSPIVAWSVSRSIMNGTEHGCHGFDKIAWIMRLANATSLDQFEKAVLKKARDLKAYGHRITTDAASILLDALSTPRAMALRADIPKPCLPGLNWRRRVTVDDKGMLKWDRNDPPNAPSTPLRIAAELSRYATDPEVELTHDDQKKLGSFAKATAPDEIWTAVGKTGAESDFDDAEAALARWAPHALVDLIRRICFSRQTSEKEETDNVAFHIPSHLLALTPAAPELVEKLCEKIWTGDYEKRLSYRRQLIALADQPAQEQIEILRRSAKGPVIDRQHKAILAPPSKEDFEITGRCISNAPDDTALINWLWYLRCAPLMNLPRGFPPLVACFSHANARVRHRAFEVAHKSGHRELADALAATGWRIEDDMDRGEAIYGSLVMARATQSTTQEELRARTLVESWGGVAFENTKSGEKEELDSLSESIRKCLDEEVYSPRKSRVFHRETIVGTGAIRAFVEVRHEQVLDWLLPVLDGDFKLDPTHLGLVSQTLQDLCYGLLHAAPEEGAKLWKLMKAARDEGTFTSSDSDYLPFRVPVSSPVDELRRTVCSEAKTDRDLLVIASTAIGYEQDSWMIGYVEELLTSGSSSSIARGIWMAGLLDQSEESETLWGRKLEAPPCDGWLKKVFSNAKQNYERNRDARYWLNKFIDEQSDRAKAYGYFRLYTKLADLRALHWSGPLIHKAKQNIAPIWFAHWALSSEELKNSVDRQQRDAEKTLFGTPIAQGVQWPWQ